jgi:hypothetical protein
MKISISGQSTSGSGYATVEDEGSPLTQRTTLNFTGAGVSASDSGGKTVVNIPGGAGAGASGQTTVDFGSFPGKSDASVAITGQSSIATNSIVNAWIFAKATSDHSADEHLVETISIKAGNIVAGTGFTIYATNNSYLSEPILSLNKNDRQNGGLVNTQGIQNPKVGGKGTRIYGQWTVNWKWE